MLRSEKTKTTYIQELTKDDVRKMKDQLDHIDPEKLIKDALIADQKSKDNQVHHKRSELLEQTRMSSISSYLESIKGKSVKEIGESSFNGTMFTNLTLPASVTKVGSQAFGNDWENAPKSRIITVNGSSKGINPFAFKAATDQFIYQNSNKEMRTFFDSSYGNLKKLKASVTFRWNKVKGASGYQVVFSADSKFKKGKKITLKQSKKKATVTLNVKKSQVKKTTYHRGVKVYGKIRPYKVVNGKKVYGRWTVNTFSCDEY